MRRGVERARVEDSPRRAVGSLRRSEGDPKLAKTVTQKAPAEQEEIMEYQVWLNGEFMPRSEAKLGLTDRGPEAR